MRQVYIGALVLLDFRIKSCDQGLRTSLDAYSLDYWNKELRIAQVKKNMILRRSGINKNVIFVDFQAKQRVA